MSAEPIALAFALLSVDPWGRTAIQLADGRTLRLYTERGAMLRAYARLTETGESGTSSAAILLQQLAEETTP